MPDRFKVKTFINPAGKIAWRVTGTTLAGKRIRENYAERATAQSRRLELEDTDLDPSRPAPTLKSTILTEQQISDAETAFQECGNRSLTSAVHRLLQIEGVAQEKEASVDTLIRFFRDNYNPEMKSISVYNAVEAFLKAKEVAGLYPKTITFYRGSLHFLTKLDPNRLLQDVSFQEIEKILSQYGNLNSRRARLRAFSVFFSWAQKRDYILDNPCGKLDPIPADDRKIEILPLEVCRKLLKAAMGWKDGEMAATIGIALFSGLRPSEIESLTPEDIRPNGIRVTGGKLRRSAKRIVPISENLNVWLSQYPFKKFPSHHRNSFRLLKEATGHKVWVQDILRHTSISFQLAQDEDIYKVATRNGTSVQMVNRHYLEVIDDPRDVEGFWKITPDSLRKVQVKIPDPKAPKTVKWPSNAALKKMVADMPMTQVGKAIGVSDNAVRKRLKKLGL